LPARRSRRNDRRERRTSRAHRGSPHGHFAYVVPSLDLVVVATTERQGISAEVDPVTFAGSVLTVSVWESLPASR
jgi:hypothetical protein